MLIPAHAVLPRAATLAAIALLTATTAQATVFTWDQNGGTAGTGGTGAWDTTSLFWNNAGITTWPAAGLDNDALFGGTAGTVSIAAGGVTANDLSFTISGYTVQSNTLTLNGTTPTISVSTGTSTISSQISGGAGLTKIGGGQLTLTGTNNYSGGTFLNAGTLATSADAHLGGAGSGIIVGGTSTWNTGGAVSITYNRDLTINGVTLNLASGNAGKTITGVLSGAGTLSNTVTTTFAFSNTANMFTGTVNAGYGMSFGSLGDSASAITIGNSAAGFTWTGGAKTFASRPFTLNAAGNAPINSSGTGALVIQQNLAFSGAAGARTLALGGTNTNINTFAGNIADGGAGSVVSLTKAADASVWALSGTNTYTGATTNFMNGGETGFLIFQGMQALSPFTSLNQNQSGLNRRAGIIKFLDDSATPASRSGVNLNFSNIENVATTDNRYWMRVFVGNNSVANGGTSASAQTNSTIQLGNLNLSQGATASIAGGLLLTGANGYKLQIADVNVALQAAYAGNWNATLRADAPLTVTGTVRQATGGGLGSTTTLQLDGSAIGSEISGNIMDSADGTPRVMRVSKIDTGTWTLSGSNTYSGTTSIQAGTLSINSIANVGGGASAIGAPTTAANGIISIGSGTTTGGTLIYTGAGDTTDRVINLAATTTGGATIDQSGTGLLKFTGNLTNAGTSSIKTLTLSGSTTGTGEFAGNLVNGAGGTLALTKSGTGTWVLSGTNTYTGITTISASGGMLQFAKQASLYNNTPASWTKTNIIVNSGGTLGLNVGGVGEFTAGDVTTLLTNLGTAINNNGLRAGSTIAFDTSNAVGTFTIANNISNSTGTGNGAIGLTKLGAGTLNLTGVSTYTGVTNINAGTLLVNGSLSAGGGDVNINNGGTLGGTGPINRHVNLNDGGTHAVGNSIGSQAVASEDWNGGGTVEIEFYNLNGTAGTDYDFLNVTNNLNVLGDLNDPVVIKLVSLDVLGNMGAANFNASQDLNPVKIVQAGSLIGFNVDDFSIDTSMITNDLLGGTFAVSTDGQGGVFLNFVSAAAVPEPRSVAIWSLLGLGLLSCVACRARRKK